MIRRILDKLIHFCAAVLNGTAAIGLVWTITHGVSLWQ